MDLFNKSSVPNELTAEVVAKAELYRNDITSMKIKPEFLLMEKFCKDDHWKQTLTPLVLTKNEDNKKNEDNNENKVEPVIKGEEENNGKHQLTDTEKTENEGDNKKVKTEVVTQLPSSGKQKRKEHKKSMQKGPRLCPSIQRGFTCNYAAACRQSHDVKAWLETKPKEIDSTCYVFRNFGVCPFGIACRFSSDHVVITIGENGEFSHVDTKNEEKPRKIFNVLSSDLKTKLWKKKYDFKRSLDILAVVNKYCNENKTLKYNKNRGLVERQVDVSNVKAAEESTDANKEVEEKDEKKVGSVTDEDLIKLRNCEKKKIDWKNKTYLAPLTTAGNLPFRRICKEFGVDITCSEMAVATNLLNGQASEWALLKRHESEDLFGIQIEGSYADTLTKACQVINEHSKVDFIDLNCGCPIDLVFNKGGGCGLMTRTDQFQRIVRSCNSVLDCEFTVKIRTGIKEDMPIAHDMIPQIKNWGASLITLHGRSRQQRYSKLANWEYINKCAQICDPIPLFGGGDILSYHDYKENMENTQVAGCMIGRGALYKPWLFTEIKEERDWDISAPERLDIIKKYANYGLEHWGSDTQGVETTRRFLLEWLSFLYRYVPVGLLEVIPQKINLRPPFFFGRNDLETLLASPNSSDWIKISEMFLGPVPEGFQFTPKHRANAY